MAAQALRFEGAEHDSAIFQNDRVEGHAQVQVADAVDIFAVVIHDEELQGQGARRVAGVGRLEGVAVADKDQPSTGHRTWPEVVVSSARKPALKSSALIY